MTPITLILSLVLPPVGLAFWWLVVPQLRPDARRPAIVIALVLAALGLCVTLLVAPLAGKLAQAYGPALVLVIDLGARLTGNHLALTGARVASGKMSGLGLLSDIAAALVVSVFGTAAVFFGR